MIDKVETAIFEAVGYSIPLELCRAAAVASIKAMRDPAFDMIEAGQEVNNLSEYADIPNHFEFLSRDEMTEAWQAMIDAALK